MLKDRVKQAVPNPGTVGVGSTVTLGAAPSGFRSFLSAFGGAQPAYFVLSDGAGRALTGTCTVNATTPETITVTAIFSNDRLGGTGSETFNGACTAWNALPSTRAVDTVALATKAPIPTATAGLVGFAGPVQTATGAAYTLPAGGTWDYFLLGFNATSGNLSGSSFISVGVAAGGTLIAASAANNYWLGKIWRIA